MFPVLIMENNVTPVLCMQEMPNSLICSGVNDMVDFFREIRILSDTLPGLEIALGAAGRPSKQIEEIQNIIAIRKRAIKLLERDNVSL